MLDIDPYSESGPAELGVLGGLGGSLAGCWTGFLISGAIFRTSNAMKYGMAIGAYLGGSIGVVKGFDFGVELNNSFIEL